MDQTLNVREGAIMRILRGVRQSQGNFLVHYTGILIHNSVQPQNTSATLPFSLECILVPPVEHRWEYQVYRSEHEVQDILEEYEDVGELQYLVRYSNGQQSEVSGRRLLPID